MRKGFAVVIVAVVLAAGLAAGARVARAQAIDVPPEAYVDPDPPPPKLRWYGWQVAAVDAAFVAAAIYTRDPTIVVVAGLGGSAIHFIRGHSLRGRISVSLRAVLALGGGFVYALATHEPDCPPENEFGESPDPLCGLDNAFRELANFGVGMAIGTVVAQVMDALVLSWEEIPDPDRPPPRPWVRVAPGGITVGVTAHF